MSESVTIHRTLTAPPELVWDAFVRPEHFATWFGTDQVPVPLETLHWKPEPGNSWSAVMHLPDGTTKSWVGTFVTVERPNRFVFTLTDDPDEPESATPLAVVLSAAGSGTAVSLTQDIHGFSEEQRAAVTAGYNAFLDTLAVQVLGLD